MAKFPWRLQGEIAKGEVDPIVTVFMGPERAVMDADGNPTNETYIDQDVSDPVRLSLSQAAAALQKTGELEKRRKEQTRGSPL